MDEHSETKYFLKPEKFAEINATYRLASNMERDKAYFYISSAAVGLLSNNLLSYEKLTGLSFLLLTLSLFLFVTTIILVIKIFGKNSDYCNAIDHNRNIAPAISAELKRLDHYVAVCFIIALSILLLNFILLGCKYLNW